MKTLKASTKHLLYAIAGIIVVAFVFVAGIAVGFTNRPEVSRITSLFNKEAAFAAPVDFEPFWKVWNLLDEKYVDIDNVDEQAKVWGAIKGLTDAVGDPYTVFFDPEENKEFNEVIEGEFSGIGIELGVRDGALTVIAPLNGSPAEKAGLATDDVIAAIDGEVTNDFTVDDAIKRIKGDKGTPVTLTVIKADSGKTEDVRIIRDTISIPTIETKLRDDGVFVISLYSFSENAPVLFQGALQKFLSSKSDKLIIDLRGNPGGYLDGAIDIASWFLPSGKVVVKEDFGGAKPEELYRSKGYNIFRDKPIHVAILVDEGSASASEILAGALREHGVATLVGMQTYGKGTVQELIPVTDTTSIKITVAKWLTPNGLSINENGLTPDYVVPLTEEDIEGGRDPQLDKAVDVLLGS